MIYTFRIVSDEVDDFKREIKIDAEASFLELRDAICKACGWSASQMSSFFLCNAGWEKQKEVTLEDMGDETTKDLYLMRDTALADLMEIKGQRLLFTFDYFTDRSLFMELTEIDPGKNMIDAVCTFSRGAAPLQEIDINDLDFQSDAIASLAADAELDIDEDMYPDESIDNLDPDSAAFGDYDSIY
ncbi:MAG: hypothetical protein K2K76_08605 [Muribaculaceae bacterium]|nr:hypothetical protein [Muribaculaceae bacterium]